MKRKNLIIIASIAMIILLTVTALFIPKRYINKFRNFGDVNHHIINKDYDSDPIVHGSKLAGWRIERQINQSYRSDFYTMDRPYLIQDPYSVNPLSALLIFDTSEKGSISVTIKGKDNGVDRSYQVSEFDMKHHEIPIFYLYESFENIVLINFKDLNGETTTKEIRIRTGSLSSKVPKIDVPVNKLEKEKLLLINSQVSAPLQIIDTLGNTRAVFLGGEYSTGYNSILEDGYIFVNPADDTRDLIRKIDLLGKIHRVLRVDGTVTHEMTYVKELDALLTVGTYDGLSDGSNGDKIIEVGAKHGEIKFNYHLEDILSVERSTSEYDGVYEETKDWIHTNGITYDNQDDSYIISNRKQDNVVKLDRQTGNIIWILGDPQGYSEDYQKYLLQPTDPDIEWFSQQHSPHIIKQDGDILTIIIYDNNAHGRESSQEYSRMVVYEIDQKKMIVTEKVSHQVTFAYNRSDADYLSDSDTYLVTNGMVKLEDYKTWHSEGVTEIVELASNGEVLFKVIIGSPSYRSNYIDEQAGAIVEEK